jgi:hypothetical protein
MRAITLTPTVGGSVRSRVPAPAVAGLGKKLRDIREASPAMSAARAILGAVRALSCPTQLERWFGLAVVSVGSYAVPIGLVFGMTVRNDDGQNWSIVQSHFLDRHSPERVAEKVSELKHKAAVVADPPARARAVPSEVRMPDDR